MIYPLTENEERKIRQNYDAFVANFGSPNIERVPNKGFYVYYPDWDTEYVQYCRNIDYLDGWLYGCVQGALVIQHRKVANEIGHIVLVDCASNDDPYADEGILSVRIADTPYLNHVLDDMRKANGYKPFYDHSGEYDENGWYDFYAVLNHDELLEIEGCVSEDCDADADAGSAYSIDDFGSYEKEMLFKRIKSLVADNDEQWDKLFKEDDDEN